MMTWEERIKILCGKAFAALLIDQAQIVYAEYNTLPPDDSYTQLLGRFLEPYCALAQINWELAIGKTLCEICGGHDTLVSIGSVVDILARANAAQAALAHAGYNTPRNYFAILDSLLFIRMSELSEFMGLFSTEDSKLNYQYVLCNARKNLGMVHEETLRKIKGACIVSVSRSMLKRQTQSFLNN